MVTTQNDAPNTFVDGVKERVYQPVVLRGGISSDDGAVLSHAHTTSGDPPVG